jgi:hypothetical protein
MASNGQRLDTATPHFKERTASVRRKQLLLQKMLLNPRVFLKQFMGRQKKAAKKKLRNVFKIPIVLGLANSKGATYNESLLINCVLFISIINKLYRKHLPIK